MGFIQKNYACPLELTMDLIGGKWKLIIIWHLLDGTKRFNELSKLMPSVTQKTLSLQLRELEDKNLISRTVYPEVPPKVEYSLTEYGHGLSKVLNELCNWSEDYADNFDINTSF